MQKKNLETASQPNLRERASYYTANFQPLMDKGILNLVEGSQEILPGITTFISNGHTQAHQMVKISDGKNTLMYCGDVVPTSTHVKIPWVMGYDLQPLVLMEEKQKYLGEAADQHWYLFLNTIPIVTPLWLNATALTLPCRKDFGCE